MKIISLNTTEISSIIIILSSDNLFRKITRCLSLNRQNVLSIPIPKPECIVVPLIFKVAIPVGAISKNLAFQGLHLYIITVY